MIYINDFFSLHRMYSVYNFLKINIKLDLPMSICSPVLNIRIYLCIKNHLRDQQNHKFNVKKFSGNLETFLCKSFFVFLVLPRKTMYIWQSLWYSRWFIREIDFLMEREKK